MTRNGVSVTSSGLYVDVVEVFMLHEIDSQLCKQLLEALQFGRGVFISNEGGVNMWRNRVVITQLTKGVTVQVRYQFSEAPAFSKRDRCRKEAENTVLSLIASVLRGNDTEGNGNPPAPESPAPAPVAQPPQQGGQQRQRR